ncbi:unnamed protein product [Pleuronectes platessa]|uniref:Uncharacterized protein n=1 Tax=Pleuronectes platessa TaxID=8262 RepID=A0A9N7YIX6_PLEPL|nr:unnamed protein product [Pleuronectes platessa]
MERMDRQPKNKRQKADQRRIQTMYISLTLFVFSFMGSSAIKDGNFGRFTACITMNGTLRLNCYYPDCKGSPPFDCQYKTSSGHVIATGQSTNKCEFYPPNQGPLYTNKTTTYSCTLTRNIRDEEMQIVINYSITKGKKAIKPCPGTTGLILHQAPAVLWPVLTVSLWRLLVPDRQTT